MIFVTANPLSSDFAEPHPIPRVKIGGVPEFPVHHVLNLRERELQVFRPHFMDWLTLNEFRMVEFYNDNPSVQQQIVQMFEDGAMSDQQVVAWIEANRHDSRTPSDVSYGFRNQHDYMAFKLRWL
jgi:hypothetical protein